MGSISASAHLRQVLRRPSVAGAVDHYPPAQILSAKRLAQTARRKEGRRDGASNAPMPGLFGACSLAGCSISSQRWQIPPVVGLVPAWFSVVHSNTSFGEVLRQTNTFDFFTDQHLGVET